MNFLVLERVNMLMKENPNATASIDVEMEVKALLDFSIFLFQSSQESNQKLMKITCQCHKQEVKAEHN